MTIKKLYLWLKNHRYSFYFYVANFVGYWYNILTALSASLNKGGGDYLMGDILQMLLSVIADIITYCLCKWLDGHGKGR